MGVMSGSLEDGDAFLFQHLFGHITEGLEDNSHNKEHWPGLPYLPPCRFYNLRSNPGYCQRIFIGICIHS